MQSLGHLDALRQRVEQHDIRSGQLAWLVRANHHEARAVPSLAQEPLEGVRVDDVNTFEGWGDIDQAGQVTHTVTLPVTQMLPERI